MSTTPAAADPELKFNLASPLSRLAAWLVDKAVLLPLGLVYGYGLLVGKELVLAIAGLVLDLAYKVILEKTRGATVGKRLLRLRVQDVKTQRPITWNQSLLRALPWALSFYAYVFLTIRYFQDPAFHEVVTNSQFLEYAAGHPLANSTIISLLMIAPFLSASWVISDRLYRALHDRLGGTVVVRE